MSRFWRFVNRNYDRVIVFVLFTVITVWGVLAAILFHWLLGKF